MQENRTLSKVAVIPSGGFLTPSELLPEFDKQSLMDDLNSVILPFLNFIHLHHVVP